MSGVLQLGYERTLEQDVAFGFRQLEDIAVKTMSSAINDPVTACVAVGHMADLLVRLSKVRMGAIVHCDGDGIGRAVVPDRDLRYYLDLACGELHRFAAAEPTVLVALLRMLRDPATAVRETGHAAEVQRAADLVRGALDPSLRTPTWSPCMICTPASWRPWRGGRRLPRPRRRNPLGIRVAFLCRRGRNW